MRMSLLLGLRTLTIGAALALTAACAQTNDPRQGGFITGISNMATGGYDRRLEREQAAVEQEAGQQTRLNDRVSLLRAERQRLARQVEERRGQLTALDRRLVALRGRAGVARDANAQARLRLIADQLNLSRKLVTQIQADDLPIDEQQRLAAASERSVKEAAAMMEDMEQTSRGD